MQINRTQSTAFTTQNTAAKSKAPAFTGKLFAGEPVKQAVRPGVRKLLAGKVPGIIGKETPSSSSTLISQVFDDKTRKTVLQIMQADAVITSTPQQMPLNIAPKGFMKKLMEYVDSFKK